MALIGFYNLGGIEVGDSYLRVTRFQAKTTYSKIGDTNNHAKYLHIEYDFSIYKDKVTALTEPENPIKKSFRNRFIHQIKDGDTDDIWTLVYDDLKVNQLFRDFQND